VDRTTVTKILADVNETSSDDISFTKSQQAAIEGRSSGWLHKRDYVARATVLRRQESIKVCGLARASSRLAEVTPPVLGSLLRSFTIFGPHCEPTLGPTSRFGFRAIGVQFRFSAIGAQTVVKKIFTRVVAAIVSLPPSPLTLTPPAVCRGLPWL
jgi:hypothetical protein